MSIDIKCIKNLMEKSPIRDKRLIGSKEKFFSEEIDRLREIKDIIDANYDNLNKKLNVALVGEVKAGKSTMFNALVGEVVSYMNVVEATANIIEIQYSEKEEVKIVFIDKGEMLIQDIQGFHSLLEENRDNQEYYDSIEKIVIYKNSEVLKKLSIVDTPGLETITKENANRTDDYLKNIDLILFVINGHHLGQKNITDKVSQLSEYGKPILAIINRIDEIDSDPDELIEYLDGEAGYMFDRILAVSAKEALEATLEKDDDLYEKSRFIELRNLLEEDIYRSSEAIQKEALENSTKVQVEREKVTHGYTLQRLDELLFGLYQDSIEIAKKNENIIQQTIDKFNYWLEYVMLSNEKVEILNANNSKQKELFMKYFSDQYIERLIEKEYKEISQSIFTQWQLYNEKIISEKTAGIEGEKISLEKVENIKLGPTQKDNTIESGIDLAAKAGTIGLGIAGYAAWLGPAASYVSIGSALGAFLPPLLIGGLVGGALIGYFKGGTTNYGDVVDKAIIKVRDAIRKSFYTNVNNEIINMSNYYKNFIINEINSMLSQFNISIEDGISIKNEIISYLYELNIIACELNLTPFIFNNRLTKYDEENFIKIINENSKIDNPYFGECEDGKIINWQED